MYSFGATVLPVWPTCVEYGYQPASTTARVAPTAPPSAFASSSTSVKFSGPPRPAAAGDDHVGILDRRARALLVSLVDHPRVRRVVFERDGHVFDLSRAPGLTRVERPGAEQRDARLRRPADVDVDGVLERGPLADEPSVLLCEVDEVPVDARVEARGKTGGDVCREHGVAEQHRSTPCRARPARARRRAAAAAALRAVRRPRRRPSSRRTSRLPRRRRGHPSLPRVQQRRRRATPPSRARRASP